MSQPDPNSPPPEEQPTSLNDGTELHIPEPVLHISDQEGDDPQAETKIGFAEIAEHRFSPSADTFSAIKDLGLRLQPAPDHNVIGRMAHYDIIRCLGRGGMGTVFEAFDTKLFRPVAIKFMASSLAASEKARSRFLREARVAASINHPNVVTIHAVDEYDGRPYLVMEFVSGSTLHDHLGKIGALPIGDILRISRQIATGLRAAHEKGIVHRDIKPGNILLENGVQRVKIVDFGLAQVIFELSDITSMGQTLGTPRYMSPEQIEGSRVDERADLFSFGCVLYMMCVGHPPFSGNSVTVLHTILRDPHVPIRQVKPQIPQALSDLVDSLLSKSRERRIQSAAVVEETITDIARGGTPSGEYLRVQPVERKSPSTSRRSLARIGAALALVAAFAMLTWAIWGQGNGPGNHSSESGKEDMPPDTTAAADTPPEVADRGPITMTVGGSPSDFPSLRAALLNVQPGDTVTVRGILPTDDTLVLNDPTRHTNLTIEWQTDTPLNYSGSAAAVITVDSVQGVRIHGAKIQAFNAHVLSVRGDCSGLNLENCRLEQAPESDPAAVVFWNTSRGTNDSPIQLNHCEIIFWELGIACIGSADSAVEWIQLKENLLRGLQPRDWGTGITFENSVRHMDVQHNRFNSVRTGLSMMGSVDQIQFSNNSFFDVTGCIGAVPGVKTRSMLVTGNLAIQCELFATGLSTADGEISFSFNKSDSVNAEQEYAAGVQGIKFVSTEAASADFLLPLADDQLKIPAIPAYAGAFEPRK